MRKTLLLPLLCAAAPLLAQAPQAPTGFVLRLGRDTVAVDRFARSGDRLEGRCLTRAPRAVLREYVVLLAPDGSARRLEYAVRPAADTLAVDRVSIDFAPDSATMAITTTGRDGGTARTQRVAAAGALPNVGNCWAFLELVTRRFVAGGAAQAEQGLLAPGGEETSAVPLQRVGADSVVIELIAGSPYRAAVDAGGRILGARRAGEWRVDRVAAPDVDALAAAWAATPMGPLSPADSLTAVAGTATLRVRYARPAARGRTIFGGVVPWNEVWRTGANEATLFETSKDLTIGGAAVPAGAYSLWTIPAPSGWTLILNRNTGQWGTDYDAQYDLARVPMAVTALATPLERVTITIEPRGDQGVLAVAWDHTRASVTFTVR